MSQDVKEISGVIADFIEQQTTNDTRESALKELGKRFRTLAPRYEFTFLECPSRPIRIAGDPDDHDKIVALNKGFVKKLNKLSSEGWEIFDGMCTGPNKTTILRRQVGPR